MRSPTLTTLLVTSTFSGLACADIAWYELNHFYQASVTPSSSFVEQSSGLGEHHFDRSISETNSAGTSISSLQVDSFIEEDRFELSTVHELIVPQGAPIHSSAGSMTAGGPSFTLTENTTIELMYELSGTEGFTHGFLMSLHTSDGQVFSDNMPEFGEYATTLTLSPGDYTFSTTIYMNIQNDAPEFTHYETSVTLQIVPAPSTLMLVSSILLTRRRRAS